MIQVVEVARRKLALRRWRAVDATTTILALHGVMSHSGWFDAFGRELGARGLDVIGLDRRGSGQAPIDEGRNDVDAWLADVRAAISMIRLEGRAVVLLGWCWGARLALAAQDEAGSEVDRLVLAAPGIFHPAAFLERARRLMAASSGETLALPFGDDDFSQDPRVREYIRSDRWRWRGQPRAFPDASRRLRDRSLSAIEHLQTPTLTVLASEDLIVDNLQTAEQLAGTTVRTQPGGHALVLERPADLADLVRAWL